LQVKRRVISRFKLMSHHSACLHNGALMAGRLLELCNQCLAMTGIFCINWGGSTFLSRRNRTV